MRLLIIADAKKAIVELSKTNQVPLNVSFIAMLLASSVAVPHAPGMIEIKKKIPEIMRFVNIATIDSLVDAFGPKCLVTISIQRNDSHETKIPPSTAKYSRLTIVLFAKRFIVMTEITKRATTIEGSDSRSNRYSKNSFLIQALNLDSKELFDIDNFSLVLIFIAEDFEIELR